MIKTDKRILGSMIEKIDRLTWVVSNHSKEEISDDFTLYDTIVYEFEKLYEDVTRLSPLVLMDNPQLPINQLRAIRNRVAHDYESVIIEVLIDTIVNDFPSFKEQLVSALNSEVVEDQK